MLLSKEQKMSRYAMCPDCGHRLSRNYDTDGYWDGETYVCDHCASDYDDEESLSVYEAALIWESNGRDEDYTFGYDEEELLAAL